MYKWDPLLCLSAAAGVGVPPVPTPLSVWRQVPVAVAAAALVGPVDNPAAHEPRKKKYAKEMWPGKKSAPTLLV